MYVYGIRHTTHYTNLYTTCTSDGGREVGQARGRTGWGRGALPRSATARVWLTAARCGLRVWRHHHRESVVGRPEGHSPQTPRGETPQGGKQHTGEPHPPTCTYYSTYTYTLTLTPPPHRRPPGLTRPAAVGRGHLSSIVVGGGGGGVIIGAADDDNNNNNKSRMRMRMAFYHTKRQSLIRLPLATTQPSRLRTRQTDNVYHVTITTTYTYNIQRTTINNTTINNYIYIYIYYIYIL